MGHGDRLVRARRDRPQSIGLRTRRRRVGRTFGRSVIHDVFIVVVITFRADSTCRIAAYTAIMCRAAAATRTND